MEKDCQIKSKRYSRQLEIIGIEGQKRLGESKVAIIGVGGLGSLVSLYLTAAGVGSIKIIDGDKVEESNLNRQIIYDENSISLPKTIIATWKLKSINKCVEIIPIQEKINRKNIEDIIGEVDLIIDCLDNWETRKILSKYASSKRIPLLHGAVEKYYGQVYFYIPDKSACLHCLAPQTSHERTIHVIGPTVGIVASIQALLAIRYLAGERIEPGILYIIDGKSLSIDKIKISKDSCKCQA